MTGPAWLPDALAALMIVTAAYCAGRVAAHRPFARRTDVDADLLHMLMGIAMAGMFEPALSPLPGPIWRAAFTACAAWFGWQAVRSRHPGPGRSRRPGPAPHAIESAAMTYMFWPVTPSGRTWAAPPMPGMTATAANLALTVVFAVYMIGYTLWIADRLASPARPRSAGQPALAPRLAAGYQITTSLAMSYMLITML